MRARVSQSGTVYTAPEMRRTVINVTLSHRNVLELVRMAMNAPRDRGDFPPTLSKNLPDGTHLVVSLETDQFHYGE